MLINFTFWGLQHSSIEDIAKQTALALKIRDAISEVASMVNDLEWIRKQIDDVEQMATEVESPLKDELTL